MKKLFRSISTFVRALPHFLAFELIYKLLLMAVGIPVLALLLKITLKVAGISYLNDENLLVYIKNPLTILVFIIILFCCAIFSFMELSALAGCFACYERHERMYVGGMFRTGIGTFRKVFRGAGILPFLLYMAVIPLAQFTLSAGMFMAPLMPILRTVFYRVKGGAAIAAFILLQLLFVIIITSGSYSIHYLLLTKSSFRDSVKKSRKAIAGQRAKMIFALLLCSLLIMAAIAAVTFGISFIIVFIIKGFSRPDAAFRSALRVLRYTWSVFTAISAFFSAPAIMCWLTGRFLSDENVCDEITLPERGATARRRGRSIAMTAVVAAVAVAVNFSYIKALYKGNVSLNVGIINPTQITAHRGFSRAAPENTMYAFEAAMDSGANYIELDVQLTADGQLVVCHDESINRTTNGKGKLSSYTYDELLQFSAGSWFGDDGSFDDARIPLLSEVLELAKGNMLLNIELKKNGDINAAAEKTVELLEEYGMEDSCYITSFSYPALKRVKQLNPKIKTGLIANFAAATSYSNLPYIDAVSMNYIFVTRSAVNTAHHNGKRVFVWTVDRPADMQKMMSLGVDNIITNRPDKASEVVNSRKVGDTVLTVLKYIFGN